MEGAETVITIKFQREVICISLYACQLSCFAEGKLHLPRLKNLFTSATRKYFILLLFIAQATRLREVLYSGFTLIGIRGGPSFLAAGPRFYLDDAIRSCLSRQSNCQISPSRL